MNPHFQLDTDKPDENVDPQTYREKLFYNITDVGINDTTCALIYQYICVVLLFIL